MSRSCHNKGQRKGNGQISQQTEKVTVKVHSKQKRSMSKFTGNRCTILRSFNEYGYPHIYIYVNNDNVF